MAALCSCSVTVARSNPLAASAPVTNVVIVKDSKLCKSLYYFPPMCCNRFTCVSFAGAVRLAGGSSGNSGRLEVYLNGEWGAVCDTHWTDRDASVICRQLGLGWEQSHRTMNSNDFTANKATTYVSDFFQSCSLSFTASILGWFVGNRLV